MSEKYEVSICDCGRIHMIPKDRLTKSFKEDKALLLICANCGRGTIFEADEITLSNEEKGYMILKREYSPYDDSNINVDDLQEGKIKEILYNHGVKVPVMTGEYAVRYINGVFTSDWGLSGDSLSQTLDSLSRSSRMKSAKLRSYIDNMIDRSCRVDVSRLVKSVPEDMVRDVISCIGRQALG